jgi:hypothetical protein
MFTRGPGRYKIQYDVTSKIITGAVIALVVFLMARAVFSFVLTHQASVAESILGIMLPFSALCVPWLFRPQAYYIDNDALVVLRSVSNIKLPYSEINHIGIIKAQDLKGMVRLFGSGGLFGYFGRFYNPKLGSVHLWIGSRKQLLMVTMKNGNKYLFSPKEEGMAEHLRELMLGL